MEHIVDDGTAVKPPMVMPTSNDGDKDAEHQWRRPNALLQRQSSSSTHVISNTSAVSKKRMPSWTEETFYQITFRGMIALLEEPQADAKRTNHYVSYGDVFTYDKDGTVRNILTVPHDAAPKTFGYLIADNVATPLDEAPIIERGNWHYKIVSSTPIPIITGPMPDAPRTKAVVLPGSVQAISLRIKHGEFWYLRLNHRTGWIADRKELAGRSISVVEEQSPLELDSSCCDSSVRSGTTVSRHRPPRRSEISMSSTVPSSNVSILSEDSSSFDKSTTVDQFFLMKVTTPKGLKILDAPQLQVHHLIHKDQQRPGIFHTMTSRTLTSAPVFDGKSRILPNHALFETNTSDRSSNLLKLSDGSGWATLPHHSSVQCAGSANLRGKATTTLRVMVRSGIDVVATLSRDMDEITSPTSSRGSDFQGSDVASSVGSTLLDAMFRHTPSKKMVPTSTLDQQAATLAQNTIPCGMVIEVEKWVANVNSHKEYARLRGGQGWVPLFLNGSKPTTARLSQKPMIRTGSFWFRVCKGQKVRMGPSRRAPSIKSNDGDMFRFECGEFLRASEEIAFFSGQSEPSEAYCKLYRNRHVRLHLEDDSFRSLESLSTPGEWVQIHDDRIHFLERCDDEPQIERHRQGWRYTSIPDAGVAIRKGPSFASDETGILLYGGEVVIVNERVSPPGEDITWLRMKDGSGWVHTLDEEKKTIMVPHSQRHRQFANKNNSSAEEKDGEGKPYEAIVTRLFQGGSAHADQPS